MEPVEHLQINKCHKKRETCYNIMRAQGEKRELNCMSYWEIVEILQCMLRLISPERESRRKTVDGKDVFKVPN